MSKSTIIIADDHPLLLKGLHDFLAEKGYNVVGKAENGEDAYKLIGDKNPDIAILDIEMPLLSGLEIARLCKKEKLKTKLILLTFHKDPTVYFEALNLSVYGYLLKDFAIEELETCIDSVSNNTPFFSRKIMEHLETIKQPTKNISLLTPSERKILKYVAADKTTKEIGDLLFISPRTVEKHRSNIINKLDLEAKTNTLLNWAKENKEFFDL